MKAFQFGR